MLKVCGLTREIDVRRVRELDVTAAGFILAPSPRRVSLERLVRLVKVLRLPLDADSTLAVGVFGEADLDQIVETATEADLDGVQLHGAASREELRELREQMPGVLLIKVLDVEAGEDSGQQGAEIPGPQALTLAERAEQLKGMVDLILLDSRVAGKSGGTGVTFSWPQARRLTGEPPFLVAGGIGPENLCQALAESGAAGADVSSGVESEPGVKDHDRLRALVEAWHRCPRTDTRAVRVV